MDFAKREVSVDELVSSVNIGTCSKDDKEKLLSLIKKYEDLFGKIIPGAAKGVQHQIRTIPHDPIVTRMRRIPLMDQDIIEREETMTTIVEHEEEKYEVGDMEDVIEDLKVEKHVGVAEATAQYGEAVKIRRTMTQPDTTVDGFETLIGEDQVEDPDFKELVKQSEGAPQSKNRLEVPRTIIAPEVLKENESLYGAMDKYIENEIMTTVVESEEEKYEVGDTKDVIEDLKIEEHVELAEERLEIRKTLLKT
ncbi:unnamed protein product [Cyprideis torosa]|uniref:Uncharacterized protein n=1 Tax=Cyprideis torosa TaxID=163714 RepID=A0A7R8WF72_9CRUS|nr:unnamed protein product [Cyprideis torosa]CAG0896663.1 unnamed protein product [Cyprideis torosa]